jgi:sterol 3beta-glucosyltransferase
MKEGHDCCIATHAEFEPWVRKHGIDFRPVDGNPTELMAICVEHGMFTFSFMREANSKVGMLICYSLLQEVFTNFLNSSEVG